MTFLINAGLTPFLPRGAPFVEVAASTVFLLRQGLSGVAAVLLLFGTVGLYLRQAGRDGRFGGAAFALAFLGSALLVAHEWSEVFLVRDLALRAPDALRALEAPGRPGLYDVGAMIALGTFTAGWIALAAVGLPVAPPSRRGACARHRRASSPCPSSARRCRESGASSPATPSSEPGGFLLGTDLLRADGPEAPPER